MYTKSSDDEADDREDRIRRMRLEQDELILKADISALKRKIESAQMDVRVFERKRDDILAQIEEAERSVKKAEEDLRMQEEEYRQLRKRMQGSS